MTKYEKETYDAVYRVRAHLTAEQIFQKVKKAYPEVVLATIYNNLNRLCRAGLVRKVSVEGRPDRYDRAEKHDHLVCCCCGELVDISFADLTASLRQAVGETFLCYDLKVFYLCPTCRKQR